VFIEDEDAFSVLRQMFDVAYSPNHITVFRYNSQPRHTLLLIGRDVSLAKVWPRLRKLVAADQRSSADRDQRGTAPDLRRVHAQLNTIMRGKGSMNLRAEKFVKDKSSEGYSRRLASMESQLSQLKRRLEE
jgi:hypothetical protein